MFKEEVFTVDGANYKLRAPSDEEYRQARKVYNRAFNDAISSGAPLKAKMMDILTQQGLWNEAKGKELDTLQKEIIDNEFVLHKGGIKKLQARAIALKIKQLRDKWRELMTPINNFNQHTAEGQADNANFDYLLSCSLVYEDGRQYFKSYEDYLSRDTEAVAIIGARKFAKITYDLAENYEATLLENQVLKELKFCDDQFRLIDNKGRLVDEEYRLINEDGKYIDEEGNFVDIYGHKLTEDGNFAIERKPFIDDEADSVQDNANQT